MNFVIDKKIAVVIASAIIVLGGFLLLRRLQPAKTVGVVRSETTSTSARNAENVDVLTSMQLAAMLRQKDFFFVNVHIPYEGEIKATDAFIPYDEIANNLEKLPKDRSAKIVLYCKSGRMSEIAARELSRLGYTRVSHLSGGMIDWEKNGYEIEKR